MERRGLGYTVAPVLCSFSSTGFFGFGAEMMMIYSALQGIVLAGLAWCTKVYVVRGFAFRKHAAARKSETVVYVLVYLLILLFCRLLCSIDSMMLCWNNHSRQFAKARIWSSRPD